MTKTKAPAFQLYAGDLLTDVMDWTDEELGAHMRLLCWSWVNRRGIPRDFPRMTRIAPAAEKCWPTIGPKWKEGPDESLINERLEATRAESDAFRDRQKVKSELAAEARMKKGTRVGRKKRRPSPTELPNDTSTGVSTDTPPGGPLEGEGEEEEKKNVSGKERALDPFEQLWITYERYGAKGKAREYWAKLSVEDRAAVIATAPAYCASTPGCRWRMNLEGWINPKNRLWERPIVQRDQPGRHGAPPAPMNRNAAIETDLTTRSR